MLSVRPASAADSHAIAALITLLGYAAHADEVNERLLRVLTNTACVLVADLDGRVVGLATAHAFDAIHLAEQAAWLTTLVVEPDAQRSGVGRALVQAVETWSREHGSRHVSVLTGAQRADAHAFYERLGFVRTGHRYTKHLTDGS
ncbi:MAG: GNAT family N-acetyltransferase [Polyangiaceae bacterium]